MYRIDWKIKARKQIVKIAKGDKKDAKSILEEIEKLKNFNDCKNIKALKNHTYEYRLRVGNYRVLFDKEDMIKIITIEEIKRRNGNTY